MAVIICIGLDCTQIKYIFSMELLKKLNIMAEMAEISCHGIDWAVVSCNGWELTGLYSVFIDLT